MEVPDKIRIFRGGKFYTRTVFPPGGKNYTDSRSRGKDYAGTVFPPKGERWARARFSGGKNYAGGKSMLQHRIATDATAITPSWIAMTTLRIDVTPVAIIICMQKS